MFPHTCKPFVNLVSILVSARFQQFSYATTAATIDSGALAGRVSFSAYVIFSIIMTGVIYPGNPTTCLALLCAPRLNAVMCDLILPNVSFHYASV
eukprot:2026227-Amphidinium_carterae.6